ncbi:MAG: trigger factor [Lachnospiraceae bacterium]|nr:trigger factor [Lachnospiraceae bacterium]
MKKRFFAALLAATMVLSFGACGSKEAKVTLGEYKGMELTNISDSEFQEFYDQLITEQSGYEAVDRAAALGDQVNIDYKGVITETGVAFDGGTATGYDLVLGSGSFIDNYEEQIVGHSAGETFDVNVTFPEDYKKEDLQGVPATFTVTLNKVSEYKTFELTVDYVKENSEFETVEEFLASLREYVNLQNFPTQIEKKLLEICTVDNLPKAELTDRTETMYNYYSNYFAQMAASYGLDAATLMSYMGFADDAALRTYAETQATNALKVAYIVREITDKENLYLDQDAYNERVELYADHYEYDNVEEFVKAYGEQNISDSVYSTVVYNYIIENAKRVDAVEEATEGTTEGTTEE